MWLLIPDLLVKKEIISFQEILCAEKAGLCAENGICARKNHVCARKTTFLLNFISFCYK